MRSILDAALLTTDKGDESHAGDGFHHKPPMPLAPYSPELTPLWAPGAFQDSFLGVGIWRMWGPKHHAILGIPGEAETLGSHHLGETTWFSIE